MSKLPYILVALGLSVPASATVVSSSSSAYAEYISLTVKPVLGASASVTSGPLPSVSGVGPGPYNNGASLLSLSVANLLSTSVLSVGAVSNVDGSDGVKFASASSSVSNLGISILGSVAQLLGISAGTVLSNASVTGDYGALVATGGTTLVGLGINGLGLGLYPAPNSVVLNLLGVKVTLNQQFFTGDGITNAGITVNAIHIDFDNALGVLNGKLGLINGNIIIGHSQASMSAIPTVIIPPDPGPSVPEPSTYVLLGTGLAFFLFWHWRKARA